MRLSTLPRSAQFFLLAVVAAGTTALVAALQTRPTEPLALAALAGFAIIFSTWQVELVVLNTVLTLGSAVVCLAMLLDGPTAAVLCAAIGALVGTLARIEPGRWLPRMRPGETLRVVFNVANCVLATGAAAAAHQATVQAV
ncbi:MAG: hypothetical protein FJX77_05875, partial [Armatimonadetes bacterium]|nr:hypothetical protein [Armatimonadota bacterium]